MRLAARKASTAILLALASLPSGGCGAPEAVRPNLVLITADAVRTDWLVCYEASTALGAEACALGDPGALYEWAFATAPSGAPSAASLLTSTYPTQHGVSDDPSSFLPYLGPPTLAEVLRTGGYATAAFVSSPELNRSRHLDRGFDHYDDRVSTGTSGAVDPVGARARAWAAATPDPWLVWVHFADPHGPFDARSARAYRAEYGEALRRLDRQLSQLIAVLDSEDSPPGILLTALHGQGLGGRGRTRGHGTSLLPAQIHVPLLWRSPRSGGGTGVGRRIGAPVSLIDVAPTLIEAAGLRAPSSFEGAPLPHSDPGAPPEADRTLYAIEPNSVAVIRGRALAIFPRAIVAAPGDRPRGPVGARVISLGPDHPSAGGRAATPDANVLEHRLRAEVTRLPSDWRGAATGPDSGS